MPDKEAKIRLASLVAYLEGCYRLPYPEKDIYKPTESMERRVGALEEAAGMQGRVLQPDGPTPLSLACRLWAVRTNANGPCHMREGASTSVMEQNACTLTEEDVGIDSLCRMANQLHSIFPELEFSSSQDHKDETLSLEGGLGVVVQKLAYINGLFRLPLIMPALTRPMMAAYASELGRLAVNLRNCDKSGSIDQTRPWQQSQNSCNSSPSVDEERVINVPMVLYRPSPRARHFRRSTNEERGRDEQ